MLCFNACLKTTWSCFYYAASLPLPASAIKYSIFKMFNAKLKFMHKHPFIDHPFIDQLATSNHRSIPSTLILSVGTVHQFGIPNLQLVHQSLVECALRAQAAKLLSLTCQLYPPSRGRIEYFGLHQEKKWISWWCCKGWGPKVLWRVDWRWETLVSCSKMALHTGYCSRQHRHHSFFISPALSQKKLFDLSSAPRNWSEAEPGEVFTIVTASFPSKGKMLIAARRATGQTYSLPTRCLL